MPAMQKIRPSTSRANRSAQARFERSASVIADIVALLHGGRRHQAEQAAAGRVGAGLPVERRGVAVVRVVDLRPGERAIARGAVRDREAVDDGVVVAVEEAGVLADADDLELRRDTGIT